MKLTTLRYCKVAFAIAVIGTVWAVRAGDLNPPPGPVGPTMKTLTEVEPRTPIESLPGSATALYLIDLPGSYYLTGNITGAPEKHVIEISADNVTLDLNGFELIGGSGPYACVAVPNAQKNLAIRNGTVSNAEYGVDAANAINSQLDNLRAADIGFGGLTIGSGSTIMNCTAYNAGISAGGSSTVIGCAASGGVVGFSVGSGSTVSQCAAEGNEQFGIFTGDGCTIERCAVSSTRRSEGIITGFACIITNCTLLNSERGMATGSGCTITGCTVINIASGAGIEPGDKSTIIDCTVGGVSSTGIRVVNDCRVVRNQCYGSGTVAISITGAHNFIDGNSLTNNTDAINVSGTENLIIRNNARGFGGTYFMGTGNSYGPIVDVAGVGDISKIANADHPWANFSY